MPFDSDLLDTTSAHYQDVMDEITSSVIQGVINQHGFDGHFSDIGDGSTMFAFTLPVPPGLSKGEYMIGAADWYYTNFTATGQPFLLGQIEVNTVWLDGRWRKLS